MAAKRVTIAEVARKAGVSPTAVSFAFNKPHRLNVETTERILQAARDLGYAPNPHARALLSQRVGVIGVLVPQSLYAIYANPFFTTFLQGVGSVCDNQDLALLTVSPLDGSLERAITSAPVDGFIIVGLNEYHHEVAPLRKRHVPVVIVDGDAETVPSVNVDDENGAYAAAAHLLANGHRNILILTFETPMEHLEDVFYGVGGRRLRGYQSAFVDYGVPWRDDRLLPTLASIEGGEQSFLQAWQAGARPTAVLTVSDAMALGVVKAASQLGLNVPQDLEVIGFDDVPLAALANPPLSTVRQPVYRKGKIATELLVAALERNAELKSVVLPTELLFRETTR